MSILLWTLAGLLAAYLLLRLLGALRWRRATVLLHARLAAATPMPLPVPATRAAPDLADPFADLPPPVRRFAKRVTPAGTRTIAAATFRQRGTFDMGETKPKWRPFTACQRVTTARPGFVWDARIAVTPGLPVHVHDAFVGDAVGGGEGVLEAALCGLVPIARLRGGGEFAEGELLRFLAEAVWYPTFLLPGGPVRWVGIDDEWARAELRVGEVAVALDFRVTADGDLDEVVATSRGRMVGGRVVPTPWRGRFWDHVERGGVRIPLAGEVAWLLPDGPRPYWRGHIERIAYDLEPAEQPFSAVPSARTAPPPRRRAR